MKTKTLNILRETKDVLSWVCLSTLILNVLLLCIFEENIAAHPNGILLNISKVLALTFILSLFTAIFLPGDEDTTSSKKRVKTAREIKILGVWMPIRSFFFLILGTLCGCYLFISLPFHSIETFDKWFRGLSIAFIIIYPFVYSLIQWLFSNPKDRNELDFDAGHDVLTYVAGLFLGLCLFVALFLVIGIGSIIIFLGIFLVKGITLLIHFIHDWGFLFYLYF